MLISLRRHRATEKILATRSRYTLYILNFVFSLHLALVSYFMSTFLVARGVSQEYVGLIYATGSLLTLFVFLYAPILLRKYGNYSNILVLGLIEVLIFFGLAFASTLPVLIVLFLAAFIVPTLISFSLDIFLEGATKDEETTSGVRGLFLTIANIAWVGAPLVGGFMVGTNDFTLLFISAAVVFIPFIFIAAATLDNFKDPKYTPLHIFRFLKTLRKNANLRNIFGAQFLLRFFYGSMVIYFPLYIYSVLKMPLSSVGIMIAFSTIAYVLLEVPLGKLEDSLWGEKEVLVIGFALITFTTAALSFMHTSSLALWIIAIFATRIGAAMIEVSSEGYFFKQVDASNANDVSAFRMLPPIAYIASPLFGTLILLMFPLQWIFLALAIIMSTGILFSGALQDTK